MIFAVFCCFYINFYINLNHTWPVRTGIVFGCSRAS